MQAYTAQRTDNDVDEFWQLEHQSVYTLGQAAQPQFLHDTAEIPIVRSDRGGQVTYHGPGQVVLYCLIDLRRRGLGIRDLVWQLEQATLDLLYRHGVVGERRAGAPGVYVQGAKIASLGLRVRRGCSYHGLALNVDMDLGPFSGIDPCGLAGMPITQTRTVGIPADLAQLAGELTDLLLNSLESKENHP